MSTHEKSPVGVKLDDRGRIQDHHLKRAAYLYIRQSTPYQVEHNTESKRRQYGRIDWVLAAGWARHQIVVVDEDQGVTGTCPGQRPGFARLVQAVGRGEVGLVISLEGARLARNGPDWAELLFLCRWSDTLIADEHGVYDLSNSADRMTLGIRGQVNQLEIDNSIQRMVEARWSKAARGEVMTIPPAGYEIDDLGAFVLTHDEMVTKAIELVFAKFDELGSARQVWQWWFQQGMLFPVRRMNLRSHPIAWKPPRYQMVLKVLRHPIYAGAYVFGRSKTVRELDPADPRKLRVRRKLMDKPRVLIRDHHAAYITWERHIKIREQLRNNRCKRLDNEDHKGAAREGGALLQGLVRCGHCGRRMYVGVAGGGKGALSRTPQYQCSAARIATGGKYCQIIGSRNIDKIVVRSFLEAVEPASQAVAHQAEQLARREQEQLSRHWQLQEEKAQYEAERAERQYQAVEPENRLVARSLERVWNQKLEALEAAKAQTVVAGHQHPPLGKAECERLQDLAADLGQVWRTVTTTDRDRKRLLRSLIEEVQIRKEDTCCRVTIVWKGGAATAHTLPRRRRGVQDHATPEETLSLVRTLAEELDDAQIARVLNRQGKRTGKGNAFTKTRISSLRARHAIPGCPKRDKQDPRFGPFTADETAEELGVTSSTIRRWLLDGVLPGRQLAPGAPWRIQLTEEIRTRLTGGDAPAGWVGLTEAARQLGLSKSRVAYMVNTGKIKAVRTTVGKRNCWRIDVTSSPIRRQIDAFDQIGSNHHEDA
jgi:DNA invertase Pin-like site-specific DNA recombinase